MIVADALMRAGYDVKQSEVHGMAQRGGSVVSHIRWGERVQSPLVPDGGADVLAAFEWAEALRWLSYVREGGAVVADIRTIVPPGACTDRAGWAVRYPELDTQVIGNRGLKTRMIDAAATATELGNVRAANSVILGTMAAFVDIDNACWEGAIADLVPKGTAEVNLEAFRVGREVPEAQIKPVLPLASGYAGPHEIEIRHDWCKSCDICSRICPEYCLALDRDAQLIVVDASACTGCRLCEMLCPDFAIEIVAPLESVAVGGAS